MTNVNNHRLLGIETDGAGVGGALNRVFATSGSGVAYSRSSTVNLMVLASCRSGFEELNTLIDSLSQVHPGRYFVVYCDQNLSSLKVDVSARCVGRRESEAVCSEVVMIGAAPSAMRAVPSVLLGNFLTGRPVELCIYEPCACEGVFDLIAPLGRCLYLDSRQFFSNTRFLRQVVYKFESVVDLEWIRLGVWREQIKLAFSRPGVSELIPYLDKVYIKATPQDGRVAALLAAGWILDRLGVTAVKDGEGSYCFTLAAGQMVKLVLDEAASGDVKGLLEISFLFRNTDWRRLGQGACMIFRRIKALETIIETELSDRSFVPLEDESWLSTLYHYFSIGESTTNYKPSLEKGLRLEEISL